MTLGSPSPSGQFHRQQSVTPFTDALRSQTMLDTPSPLSRHSLASFTSPLKRVASPKNNPLAHRSFFEKAARPQPSSTAAAAAVLEDAYRPVTSIPCQDPGSRYRAGHIARRREERPLPDHRSALTQVGSADKMIAAPFSSSPLGGAQGTTMDDLAHEAVYVTIDHPFLKPKTPLGPGEMLLRNVLREKRTAAQGRQTYHAGFSPGAAERLSEGLVSRVITGLPKNKDVAPRPQAEQDTPGEGPLEEGAHLKTQMDYFLYFNPPTVGTIPPLSIFYHTYAETSPNTHAEVPRSVHPGLAAGPASPRDLERHASQRPGHRSSVASRWSTRRHSRPGRHLWHC
ncbi:hypothetical protein LZ30DRAFT_363299 [Colletotrichum cereale]|nr:hypothetical protein LZ30DRAFT_363299 [Colletotrichum cereale]